MRKTLAKKSINIKDKEDLLYQKLKQSRFYQQRLPAWRPVPTICSIVIFYSIFSLIFLIIGIFLIEFSNEIKEIEIKYNEYCKRQNNNNCKIELEIKEDIPRPIFIYYKIYGFFQNHRRYMKSRSLKQLMGETISLSEIKSSEDCAPLYTNEDMGFKEDQLSLDGKTFLIKDKLAIPCGIMAKTFFNDNFSEWKINDIDIIINEKNIAWDKDKELFKNTNISEQWIDVEDEHFIVWMRPAGLPDVKKLWGRIEKNDLKKGDKLTIRVESKYDVDKFNGDKSIILGNSNIFGGNNTFLGICFIVVGIISLFIGIGFVINYCITNKRKEKEK